ncbi:unnamed protein product [Heligmosomoides polygyrus]|uniref:Helicase C-terminal domain-containing protein n=1 Tax=Heligmosomoides polygyrus TaxID=6339 RepID=A0A3P8D114_HELPZ|nr:unnamed protein product [Heligmosomoides polygyrus]
MTLPRIWTLQVIPGTGRFNDFAVSSSSEHCSELASPETGCRYTPGESRMSRNPELIQKFVQEVTADPLMESRGVLTELVPFDMITTLGLLQNSTTEQLEAVKSFLAMEHGNMLIALTTSGVDPLDIGFLIKEVTLFDPNEELSRRGRGDLVVIPEFELKLERYFGALKYMNKPLFRAYLNATLNPYRSINDQTFTSDLAMIEELVNSPLWIQTNMTFDGGVDIGYCHPLYPSIAPYLFSILAEYRVGAEELSGAYHTADRALTTVYRTLRELYTKVSMLDTPDDWMPLYDIVDRKEMYRKFGGNYFSMVVNDQGYAFSGTIGSSLQHKLQGGLEWVRSFSIAASTQTQLQLYIEMRDTLTIGIMRPVTASTMTAVLVLRGTYMPIKVTSDCDDIIQRYLCCLLIKQVPKLILGLIGAVSLRSISTEGA